MSGWSRHAGLAIALPIENIDTDQIIPARFMTASRDEGYGQYLLYDMRHDKAGYPYEEHPLNACKDASVLITRRNFGSGSSREAAVYALVDAGFKAVLAPSFGDIFSNNAVNNGLLPAQLADGTIEILLSQFLKPSPMEIDLEQGTIKTNNLEYDFQIDPVRQLKLIKGWSDIDLTQSEIGRIRAFSAERREKAPWAWPCKTA